ncbi:MAG TPA: HD domain-containing phosphohydrolase [Microvirga sp.]|jgi:putative nucleotidyltransferase with HDIG domain
MGKAVPAPAPGLRLAELLGALSYALDLTEGQPAGHCVRCCWIGVQIGHAIGLSDDQLSSLYYTLLLKDLGCSSNAARICELYLTDDLVFKRDFKRVGDSLPQVLGFVLAHTGLKAGLAERFQAILNIVQNGGQIARELIETRCQRGAKIARDMRFPEAVAQSIQDLDEHWNGGGRPQGLKGQAIPLHSRIALLAQVVDVFHTGSSVEETRREIRRRSGTWFDPALVEAFERLADRRDFWAALRDSGLAERVYALEPAQRMLQADDDYLDDIAIAFAGVIDAKSPYTHGHSERVALFTDLIARELGFSLERRRWLKRAALLHDIGKLGVANAILDKAGRLDEQEMHAMRAHAAMSETILSRIGAFGEIARIAGSHHERLDGRGYPRGLKGDEIAIETRIVTTADIFDALTADRPYRAAMPAEQAFAIMAKEVGTATDPVCFTALQDAMARLDRAA